MRQMRIAGHRSGRLPALLQVKAVENKAKSDKTGRPVFEDKLWLDVYIDQRSTYSNELDLVPAMIKDHYAREIEEFLKGNVDFIEGTPLSEWPVLTESQRATLEFQHVFTVEQIAGWSDTDISSYGMGGSDLKSRAQEYLAQSKDAAMANASAREKEQLNAAVNEMRAENAQLKEQLDALKELMQETLMAQQKASKPGKLRQEEAHA